MTGASTMTSPSSVTIRGADRAVAYRRVQGIAETDAVMGGLQPFLLPINRTRRGSSHPRIRAPIPLHHPPLGVFVADG